MLHVTYHRGKSSLYKRYLRGSTASQDDGERNIHKEDEIVSTIFGPLDFLEPPEVYRFWSRLLMSAGKDNFLLPEATLKSASIEFWPRYNSVEPDAHLTFEWSGGEFRTLLIEFKWHANLSGDDQLQLQWKKYPKKQTDHDHAIHLFIAPEISEGIKARNENDVWGGRLLLISWMEVCSTLNRLAEKDRDGLGRWAKYAANFLGRVGIYDFTGFRNLTSDPFQLDDVPPVLFWKQSHD